MESLKRKPVTTPVLDNSMEREHPAESASKIELSLPQTHFNTVIRNVLSRDLGWVKQVLNQTFITLKRLGVERNLSLARHAKPEGSDHLDLRTIVEWTEKITDDAADDALYQLLIIDATAKVRVTSNK